MARLRAIGSRATAMVGVEVGINHRWSPAAEDERGRFSAALLSPVLWQNAT
jgi:hypothetical protein